MIPLYGFLEGDTVGLVVLADEKDTMGRVAGRLLRAAAVRVDWTGPFAVRHGERTLDPATPLESAGLKPLDRFDVVKEGPPCS